MSNGTAADDETEQTKMATPVTTLPTRLSFSGEREGRFPKLVPGRGEAGWTVYKFKDARDAAQFFQSHQHCAMPCWARFGVLDGELMQVR